MLPQLLAAAAIGAVSPPATLAAIMLLSSKRPVANTIAFLLGWSIVLVAIAAILLLVLGGHANASGESAKASVGLLVGLLLLVVALRSFLGALHPVAALAGDHPDAAAEMPAWMRRIEQAHPASAFLLGMAVMAISPANLAAFYSAVQALIGEDLATGPELLWFVLLIAAIDICIVVPLAIYVLMPGRAASVLDRVEMWFVAHQSVVSAAAAALFGVLLIVNSIATIAG